MKDSDYYFMNEAIKEAQKAYNTGEVPVGAVVTIDKVIVAKAHNQVERLRDATAHAEILAITSASDYLGSKYLKDCYMYATLEPCHMCAGAMYWTQLGRVVYGADDKKRGFSQVNHKILHPSTSVTANVMAHECSRLITTFFAGLRFKCTQANPKYGNNDA